MLNKRVRSVAEAVADVKDGATVMVGGFGTAGIPNELIEGLIEQGARDLVIVNNNAGNGDTGLAALLKAGRARKIICSFPRQADSYVFDELYRAGKLELELVPQGNLAERIARRGCWHWRLLHTHGLRNRTGQESRRQARRKRAISTDASYVLEYADPR